MEYQQLQTFLKVLKCNLCSALHPITELVKISVDRPIQFSLASYQRAKCAEKKKPKSNISAPANLLSENDKYVKAQLAVTEISTSEFQFLQEGAQDECR